MSLSDAREQVPALRTGTDQPVTARPPNKDAHAAEHDAVPADRLTGDAGELGTGRDQLRRFVATAR